MNGADGTGGWNGGRVAETGCATGAGGTTGVTAGIETVGGTGTPADDCETALIMVLKYIPEYRVSRSRVKWELAVAGVQEAAHLPKT